ncbi:MAG: hypothetical protein HYU54_02195, partial [Actinobacteria bacterium]|nr:hypothetical protein [Actinomycetota bacterium]
VRFEEQVADWVNEKLGRLAVTQVVRVSSAGVDGVQLADLLLGAVAYDCRVGSGYVPSPSRHKTAFVQDLRGRLGVATLSQPFRNARVNIAFHGRTGTAARSQRKRRAIGRPPNASQ